MPTSDDRWPAIADAIMDLRDRGRCSIRIVDCDCGAGETLMCAARYARSLGFTAIEARGVDGAAALVARACSRAARLHDSAIGVTFERRDPVSALRDEADFPADIVLWHDARTKRQEILAAVAAAADIAIGDTRAASGRRSRVERAA
ncbi:SAM-dependent methyltransferase [Sphingomonas sp. 4RDLI-65]|uniref:SAM-dependent methyltransferase n=1 Tax=Sphingomonas sp. 4RDLI-65 TaxID=3111641 RepID=UPI003C217E28